MSFEALSSQAIRRPETSNSTVVPDGTFAWAAVHQYNAIDTGQLKASCLDANRLYISSRKGIYQVDSATGRYEEFQRADATQQLSHNLAVTNSDAGPLLWACNGNGITSIYNIHSRALTRKAFPAHTGEVLTVLSINANGSSFLISGGADFQVKTWSPNGDLLSASGHHHAAVQCLAVVPVTSPPPTPKGSSNRRTSSAGGLRRTNSGSRRSTAAAYSSLSAGTALKVWAGAADGTLSVCVDPSGMGVLDPAGWRQFKAEGMKGARCMLLLPDNRLWVGCDDGRVFVFDGATEVQLSVFKAAPAGINCLAAVGAAAVTGAGQSSMPNVRSAVDGDLKDVQQVWAASEKLISVHEPMTGVLLFTLPVDPDGFVKALLPWDWGIWVLSFNSLRQLAVRAAWQGLQQQAAALADKLTSTHQSLYDCQVLSGQQAVQLQQQEQRSLAASALQAQLEQQLQQANQQIMEHSSQLQLLQQQLQDATEAYTALQQQANAAQQEAAALATDQLAAKEQQLAQTLSELAASRDEAGRYRSQLDNLTAEADSARSQLARCQDDLAQAQQRLTTEATALDMVKAEVHTAHAKISELQGILGIKGQEAAVQEQQAAAAITELEAVKVDMQQLRDAMAARDTELHDAQAATVALQEQLHAAAVQHATSAASTEDQHKRLMADLQQELDKLTEQHRVDTAAAEQLQQHAAELQQQLARVQAEQRQHHDAELKCKAANDQLETDMAAATAAAEAANSQVEQLQEELKQNTADSYAQLTATQQRLEEVLQQLQQEQQAHQAAISAQQEMQREMANLQQLQQGAASDAAAYAQQLLAMQEQMVQHEQALAEREQQLATLRTDHQSAVTGAAALTEEVSKHSQRAAELQQVCSALENKLQQQEAAAAEAAAASSMAATSLAADLANARGELLSVNAELKLLQEQFAAAQGVREQLQQKQQQVHDLQQRLGETESRKSLATEQVQAMQRELEANQKEQEQMRQLLQQAQQELAMFQQGQQQLQNQLQQCQAEAEAARETKQQLQEQLIAAKALQDDKSAAVMQELRQLQKQLSSRKRSHAQQMAEMTERETAVTAKMTQLEQDLTAAEQRAHDSQAALQERDILVQQLQQQIESSHVQHAQQLEHVQKQAASRSDNALQQQQEMEQQVKHLQRRLSQAVREQRDEQSTSTASTNELKQELYKTQQLLQQEKSENEQRHKDFEAAQMKMQQLQQQLAMVEAVDNAAMKAVAAAEAQGRTELYQARLAAVETKITDLQEQMHQAKTSAAAAGAGAGFLHGAAANSQPIPAAAAAAAAAAVPTMMMVPCSSAAPSVVIHTGPSPSAMQQQQACSPDTAAAIGAAAAAAAAAAELKAQQAESKFTMAGQQLMALTAERDDLQRKLQAHYAGMNTRPAASQEAPQCDGNTTESLTATARLDDGAAAAAARLSSSLHAEVSLAEFARAVDDQQGRTVSRDNISAANGAAAGTAASPAAVLPGASTSDVHVVEVNQQVEELCAELNGMREDRYQLQIALKAANKQLAVTQAQLKAVQAAAAATAQQHITELAALKQAKDNGNPSSSRSTSSEQEGGDDAVRHKLAQLEGALRQASADYALILGELSKIRGEGAERQAALETALAGRAAAEVEVQRCDLISDLLDDYGLQQLLGSLQQQLSVSAQLHKTHQGVLQRVTSAAGPDQAAAMNQQQDQQTHRDDSSSSQSARQPRVHVGQDASYMHHGDSKSELCGQQQQPPPPPQQQQPQQPRRSSGDSHRRAHSGATRDRCLPPTGYL